MSTDYGKKYINARERVLLLLMDMRWHGYRELEAAGGNRYSARVLELKRLGYRLESRIEDEDGKAWRLINFYPGPAQPKRVKAFFTESDAAALADGLLTGSARIAITDALASFRANKDKL